MFGKTFCKVAKKLDKSGDIFNALQEVDAQSILAGIPEGDAPRPVVEAGIPESFFSGKPHQTKQTSLPSNAELAYIHSKGAPMHNIPARPFMEPSIEKNKDTIAKLQGNIIRAALEGKVDIVNTGSQRLGMYIATEAKRYFTDESNGWAPNAPSTIARKGSDQPLIDTAALRNAITYVLESKNK